MPFWFGELTWPEIDNIDKKRALCVLPIAAIEQHGPHLPVATDFLVLTALINKIYSYNIKDMEPLLFLPPIPYSKSIEHLPFPGTIVLYSKTMLALIDDLIASLAISKFQKVVIINGHGGNTAFLRGISQELRYRYQIKIFHIDYWGVDFFNKDLPHDSPWENEIHGGEVETSLLLYLAPKLVKKEALSALNFVLPKTITREVATAWLTSELNNSGVLGNPEKASEAKGGVYFNFIVNKIVRDLKEIQGENDC